MIQERKFEEMKLTYNGLEARVVKLVDTADLKSAASLIAGVPVRFRFRAPIIE
jgi:hypothetical protein